eukprot:CAMPEP_0183323170 /NCGR_PEP_ID=MMETSP0160_2-20130417/73760_1 /TAXON_ID=2839 ORGANISM="Odontella Sinensis, Strain Grunow 1884" /NCGR_SAMPLE_ID=MMETSP0160_2 /ASSEMBLY_ACC=CAM_ASM_000250 /LENGTH=48 /DNA_ID= /DNA_START= /DNA_END= /DNA_ORIENTATION=
MALTDGCIPAGSDRSTGNRNVGAEEEDDDGGFFPPPEIPPSRRDVSSS